MSGNARQRDSRCIESRLQNDSVLSGGTRLFGPAEQLPLDLESDLGLDVDGATRVRVEVSRDREFVARIDVVRRRRWTVGVTQFGEAQLLDVFGADGHVDATVPVWLAAVVRAVGVREVQW